MPEACTRLEGSGGFESEPQEGGLAFSSAAWRCLELCRTGVSLGADAAADD